MPTAFDPIEVSGLTLNNRIAMAPLTRRRAYGPALSATPLMAQYYEQRASAGLIIGEAMQPSPIGQGYTFTPGMHSDDQARSWTAVTDRVHRAGGHIFGQLQHAGRNSHPDLLPDGLHPVGPSAVAADGVVRVNTTGPAVRKPYPTPREMSPRDIDDTIEDFASAAEKCIQAGFDGVELHGAYGYLIHQFLSSNANLRTDGWGTTVTGRIRFAVELTDAVSDRIGAERLALRVSPGCTAGGIDEDDLDEVYSALVDELPTDLAFVHVFEFPGHRELTRRLRRRWHGVLILNPHRTHDDWPSGPAQLDVVESGVADMVAFGSNFISNPDLVTRLRTGAPLTDADHATFYLGDERGYTDYPTLADAAGRLMPLA
ncbi:alkene reductase [Rhodococcoides trifolii]|uniref:Alkene reductase n=1 Tax=Rhodococcoides trifolii TaxID=908250 RepID=A0A917LHL8_9NOCA|nr:alkene reductase [Rhodococcus trifolii]GGG24448.1 alkene reductase [Rhodococcus trifolii]